MNPDSTRICLQSYSEFVFFKYSSLYISSIKHSCNNRSSCIFEHELPIPICTYRHSWMDVLGYAFYEHAYAYPMHNDTFEHIISQGLWLGLDGDGDCRVQGLVFYILRSAKCKSFVGKILNVMCKVHIFCQLCVPCDL